MIGAAHRTRTAETVAISTAEEVEGIGTVEDGMIVVAVMIGTDVAGGILGIMTAKGTNVQAVGEAMIATTLVTVEEVAVKVVVMIGRCPSGCASWPERTLVSEVETATMGRRLVAEGTSGVAVT